METSITQLTKLQNFLELNEKQIPIDVYCGENPEDEYYCFNQIADALEVNKATPKAREIKEKFAIDPSLPAKIPGFPQYRRKPLPMITRRGVFELICRSRSENAKHARDFIFQLFSDIEFKRLSLTRNQSQLSQSEVLNLAYQKRIEKLKTKLAEKLTECKRKTAHVENLARGAIYKITNTVTDHFYIGQVQQKKNQNQIVSIEESIQLRFKQHKASAQNGHSGKNTLEGFMRVSGLNNTIPFDSWQATLLQEVAFVDCKDLLNYESFCIQESIKQTKNRKLCLNVRQKKNDICIDSLFSLVMINGDKSIMFVDEQIQKEKLLQLEREEKRIREEVAEELKELFSDQNAPEEQSACDSIQEQPAQTGQYKKVTVLIETPEEKKVISLIKDMRDKKQTWKKIAETLGITVAKLTKLRKENNML